MNLRIAQVIGLNTDQKAAQVISVTREGNSFLAVLILSSDDAFTKGRQALSELSDFFFEGEGTPAERINSTFEEAKNKFSSSSGWDLIIASIWGKVLYLLGQGEVEAYLKRDNKISSLLSVGSPAQLISGFIGDGDRLFFATKSLITFLGEDLEKTLSLPLENFEEEVESKIGASESENQGLAVLAIEAQESEKITTLPQDEDAPILDQEPSFKDQKSKFAVLFAQIFNLLSYAKIYFPKSGRSRLILAIILLLIITGGAGYKYKAGKDRQKDLQFTNILQQARDNLNAAKGLSSLNPAEAKAKLDSARDEADKAYALKPKNQDALNLKKEIESESPSILLQSSVSDFPEFLDMDLVKKNFRATKMSLSNGKLLLLDQDIKTLAVVDINKKSNEILAGSQQLGDAVFASLNGGSAFVYSKDKGILKIDIQNSKISQVTKQDSEWGVVKDLYGFASNVYLLDSGQIWKYVPTSDGYSDKRAYLSKEVKADFEGAQRMQIESSVYLLKSGGEILRFTKGEKDNFSYEGLPGGVKEVKSIFVSSDTEELYILDSGNSRLLILTKTGVYKGQITGPKFAEASDLVVDEQGKKVYLLEGSKIYSVDLK